MIVSPSKVRALALAAASKRSHKFTRVGKEFIQAIENAARIAVIERVARHPSKGQTLQ